MNCSLHFLSRETSPEFSPFPRALACVPLVGIIPSIYNEPRLQNSIKEAQEKGKLKEKVELLNTKLQYAAAGVVRNVASSVIILALHIFRFVSAPLFLGLFAGLYLGLARLCYYQFTILSNIEKEVRKELPS